MVFRFLFVVLLAAPVQGAEILATLQSDVGQNILGMDMGWVGDISGDGFADFIVVDSWDEGVDYAGRAYVYFGGHSFDGSPDLVLQLEGDGRLEKALLGPFDFNGDGCGDIAISSPNFDIDGKENAGAVFIYFGGAQIDDQADHIISGDLANNYIGEQISSAGHFNVDDDYDDIAVTRIGWRGITPPPTVFVYGGGPEPSISPIWGRVYTTYDNGPGVIAYAGDANGDESGDLVVGLPFTDGWLFQGDAGQIDIFYGGEHRLEGGFVYQIFREGDGLLGTSVDGAFDFNGDGYDDVVATSPGHQESRLFLGGYDTEPAEILTLFPGECAAGLGDVNADGYDDMAISGNDGFVWVFRGGADPDTVPDYGLFIGPAEEIYTIGVARAGDLNADGCDDIAVFQWRQRTSSTESQVQIYSGRDAASAVPSEPLSDRVFSFDGAFPNPFNAGVAFQFTLSSSAHVAVRLFDARGRLVRTLFNGEAQAGQLALTWDGRDHHGASAPSGVYFAQITGLGRAAGGRVTMVR